MASASAFAVASPSAVQLRRKTLSSSGSFFHAPIQLPAGPAAVTAARSPGRRIQVRASLAKEKVAAGLTTAALTAALVIPEVAEAAQPGLSPSLKNFLLSILSGGVVLGAIVGAVVAVSNFDPVKRR